MEKENELVLLFKTTKEKKKSVLLLNSLCVINNW